MAIMDGCESKHKTPTLEERTCPSCGAANTGKFCVSCGTKKPVAETFRCDKCGWVPADPANPPKFCPQCGDPFNAADQA